MSSISGYQAGCYLRELVNKGVNFYVNMPTGGCIDLDPDQVIEFTLSENVFWAKHYDCEVNQFIAWLEVRDSGVQCCYIKKNKKQCNNWAPAGERPGLFVPGGMKCQTHGGNQ